MTKWYKLRGIVSLLVLGYLLATGPASHGAESIIADTSTHRSKPETDSIKTSGTLKKEAKTAGKPGLASLLSRLRAGGKNSATRSIPAHLELIRDVTYSEGSGSPLALDILRRKDLKTTAPVIVYIHGGGWRAGSKDKMPRLLTELADDGYFCVSVQYRLTSQAVFPAQIEDCKCAIRWLRAHAAEYKLSDKIGVWGTSAGGHLAALLGTSGDVADLEGKGGWNNYSSRVQAVVNSFGPTDLLLAEKTYQDWGQAGQKTTGHGLQSVALLLGGSIIEKRAEAAAASPVTYISADDPPFFMIHGAKDYLVPVTQSVTFDAALKKAGLISDIKVLPLAGHMASSAETERMTIRFFEEYLKK